MRSLGAVAGGWAIGVKSVQSVGIIGFGQFGQLLARHLPRGLAVIAHDEIDRAEAAGALGVTMSGFDAACGCDVVVFAMPVQAMEAAIAAAAALVRPGALVVDVASVKTLPARWMAERFAPDVQIVATHPLFGPQSARGGLARLPLVLCPVRGRAHLKVAAFGRRLGLAVTVTTAREHDEEMAYVQALTHLIGRSLANLGIPDEKLKTRSYQHLLELCDLLRFDTMALFEAIQDYNPHARGVTDRFVDEIARLRDAAGRRA